MGPEVAVTVGGLVLAVALAWFFFGPKKARTAALRGAVQEVEITVKGGYSPDLIRVRRGVPVRLIFDRRESGDRSARVVFPDFRVGKSLPAFTRTSVEFVPNQSGEFGFVCGMNMVHGTLIVEADAHDEPAGAPIAATGEVAGQADGTEGGDHADEDHAVHVYDERRPVAAAVGVGPAPNRLRRFRVERSKQTGGAE